MFSNDWSLCQDWEKERKKVLPQRNEALQCHQLRQGYQCIAERQHIKGLFNCWLIAERRVSRRGRNESLVQPTQASGATSPAALGARGGAGEPSQRVGDSPQRRLSVWWLFLHSVLVFSPSPVCRAHQQRAGEPLRQPPGGHCRGTHVRTVHHGRFLRELHRFSLPLHRRHRR